MTTPRKIVIIGSGPAGYTAAIYAARANLAPLMFTGVQYGGQLMLTTLVENYPGFVDGIQGPELMETMQKQAAHFGTEMINDDVTAVDFTRRPFVVTAGAQTYEAQTVVIATGASSKLLGVPGESKLMGRGVSTCATCDGFFFKGQELAVVGGGDSALEEAMFLTKFATKVTVIHRRDTLRASKIMQDRARKNEKIAWIWDSTIDEVLGTTQGKVSGARVRNLKTGAVTELPLGGLFVAIGHTPNTQIVAGQMELDAGGYIVTASGSTRTSVAGVFAAGDVADHIYRQAVTAAGTGCMAAIDAERYLEAQGSH